MAASTAVARARKAFRGMDEIRLGGPAVPLGVLRTGADSLDVAIGVGGWPEGRFAILHGAEASGKSTLALHAVAECQRVGGVALYLDFEAKLDFNYAAQLGVDVDAMAVACPRHIEAGFGLLHRALDKVRDKHADCSILLVWDSLQAAVARRTFEGDYDKEHFNPEAPAYSRGLAKFVPRLASSRAILLGISQVRMTMEGYITKERIGVGKAPMFYASVVGTVKATKPRGVLKATLDGEDIAVTIRKNQVGRPWNVAKFPLLYGSGVHLPGAVLEAAIAVGLAEAVGKGGYFTVAMNGEETPRKVHGLGGMSKIAKSEPDVFEGLRTAILTRMSELNHGGERVATVPDESEAETDDEGEDG